MNKEYKNKEIINNPWGDWTEEDDEILNRAQDEVIRKGLIDDEAVSFNVVLEAIRIAQQGERVKLSKYLIDQLSEANPYPSDVFIPRSKEEMKAVADLIAKAGYSPDGIFGQVSREAWNNAVEKLKELIE